MLLINHVVVKELNEIEIGKYEKCTSKRNWLTKGSVKSSRENTKLHILVTLFLISESYESEIIPNIGSNAYLSDNHKIFMVMGNFQLCMGFYIS